MGAKRGSIILSRELLDEYIDERGLDQVTVMDKVRWRHHCGTEWEARVKDRRQGPSHLSPRRLPLRIAPSFQALVSG